MSVAGWKVRAVQVQYALALTQDAWGPLVTAAAGMHSMLPVFKSKCFQATMQLLRH